MKMKKHSYPVSRRCSWQQGQRTLAKIEKKARPFVRINRTDQNQFDVSVWQPKV
jgi:hypothetical protein